MSASVGYQLPTIDLGGGYTARLYGRGPQFTVRISLHGAYLKTFTDVFCHGYEDPASVGQIWQAVKGHLEPETPRFT